MPSSGLGAYQVKIHQIVFGGLFLGVVLIGVQAMMGKGASNFKMLALVCVLIGVVLALDKYYWVLCPLLFSSGIKIPGVPLDGKELSVLLLIGVYFVRQGMQKEPSIRMSGAIVAALPIFCWICFIWFLNPTGMAILGSASVGARFYLKIVLGFGALLVLSALRFEEKDCKVLFYVVLASALISLGDTMLSAQVDEWTSSEGSDEAMVRYEFLGALPLFVLLFSRYSLSEISTSLWKLVAAVGLAAVTVITGKRSAFGTLAIIPFLRCFFTGRDKMLTVVWSVVGAFVIGIAVAGHGTLYELPSSAQRALSLIIPSFRTDSVGGMSDQFREGVRRYGRDVIRDSPWVGRKGFAMDRAETSWMLFGGTGDAFYGHAFAGNWHSMWYAFACDFGLPAMFMWAGFMLYAVVWTYRGFFVKSFCPHAQTIYLYYAYSLFKVLIFSYTSGHSALSALSTWVVVGLLAAIRNGAQDRQRVFTRGTL